MASLAGGPLRIPAARVAAFDTIVLLQPTMQTPSRRLVSGVWRLAPTREGIRFEQAALDAVGATDDRPASELGSWFPRGEVRQREALLRSLRDGGLTHLPRMEAPRVRARHDEPLSRADRRV